MSTAARGRSQAVRPVTARRVDHRANDWSAHGRRRNMHRDVCLVATALLLAGCADPGSAPVSRAFALSMSANPYRHSTRDSPIVRGLATPRPPAVAGSMGVPPPTFGAAVDLLRGAGTIQPADANAGYTDDFGRAYQQVFSRVTA